MRLSIYYLSIYGWVIWWFFRLIYDDDYLFLLVVWFALFFSLVNKHSYGQFPSWWINSYKGSSSVASSMLVYHTDHGPSSSMIYGDVPVVSMVIFYSYGTNYQRASHATGCVIKHFMDSISPTSAISVWQYMAVLGWGLSTKIQYRSATLYWEFTGKKWKCLMEYLLLSPLIW